MFKDKLKELISKNEDAGNNVNNKKKIENLFFLVIVLIITIVVINYVWNGKDDNKKTITNSVGKELANKSISDTNTDTSLEGRLEKILSNIKGVSSAKVFINYSESTETVAMYNENSKTSITEETDNSGGIRKIEQTDSEKELVYQEDSGNKVPIIKKTVEPKIEGAIVTANGASNSQIKSNIIDAIEAATGLSSHKIQVFESN